MPENATVEKLAAQPSYVKDNLNKQQQKKATADELRESILNAQRQLRALGEDVELPFSSQHRREGSMGVSPIDISNFLYTKENAEMCVKQLLVLFKLAFLI